MTLSPVDCFVLLGSLLWGFIFVLHLFGFLFFFSFALILSAQSREERNNIAHLNAIVFTQATFSMTFLPEVCKILPVL